MKTFSLFNKRKLQRELILIDDEDFKKVKSRKWLLRISPSSYRITTEQNGYQLPLSNYILNLKRGTIVDHIDRNPFNNQKSNLRVVDHQENCFNNKPHYYKKYKGTSFSKAKSKYTANIRYGYKLIYLGAFETEIEAAKAYDAKAKVLFGEFAYLNFPE